MLGAGVADGLGEGFAVYIVEIAGNGDDDPGLSEIGNADGLAEEILEHQLGNIEIGNEPVPDRPDGHQPVGRAAEEEARLIADGPDGAAVLAVEYDKGRLGNDDAAPPHIEADVFGSEVNADIRSPEWHERIILYASVFTDPDFTDQNGSRFRAGAFAPDKAANR